MKKLTLVFILISTALVAVAQTPDPKSTEKTRARTVAANTSEPAKKDVDNITDPVTSLREELAAAANDADRNRLHLKLADLLLATGQKTEALAELHEIGKSNAFDPVGFYNLGNAFARLGETEFAINAYQTAIDQRNGRYSRALNNLGVLLLRVGRWDDAYEALVSALKIENFRYAEASYNLGRVYAVRGQNDLASREWRRAVLVDPQHTAAAQALARNGNEERIVVVSAKDSRKPAIIEVKAAAENKPASFVAAKPAAVKPLTLNQTSFEYLQRARSAFERGKMTEAVSYFQRVLKLEDGYFPPASLELSFALIRLRRNDEALATLLEVTKRDGARYPISYFHLARLYELKSEFKLAEAAYSQAAAAPGNSPQFLLDLSRVREKLGDFKGALEAFEDFLKLAPEQGQRPADSDERLAELRAKVKN